MQTSQNITNSDPGSLKKISDLLAKTRKLNQEIKEANNESRKEIENLNTQVDKTINNIEQIFSELDQIEKEAGDEMDKLILEEAVSLSEEE